MNKKIVKLISSILSIILGIFIIILPVWLFIEDSNNSSTEILYRILMILIGIILIALSVLSIIKKKEYYYTLITLAAFYYVTRGSFEFISDNYASNVILIIFVLMSIFLFVLASFITNKKQLLLKTIASISMFLAYTFYLINLLSLNYNVGHMIINYIICIFGMLLYISLFIKNYNEYKNIEE